MAAETGLEGKLWHESPDCKSQFRLATYGSKAKMGIEARVAVRPMKRSLGRSILEFYDTDEIAWCKVHPGNRLY